MKLLARYLKSFIIPVLLCLAFLLGQAIADLTLPNLMSDIVSTGIQLGGIESGAPEVIDENGMKLLTFFMTQDQQTEILSVYTFVSAGGAGGSVSNKFPQTEKVNFYQLNEKNETVDAAYSNTAYALMSYISTMMGIEENTGESGSGETDLNISALYQMIPLLQELPSGALDSYKGIESEDGSMLQSQIGTTFTRLFYKELGADLDSIQINYILITGLKMLAVALCGVAAAICVGFISVRVAASVSKKMRHDMFSRVSSFSGVEFDMFSTASLITRTTNDVQQVQMLTTMGIRMLCYAPIMCIGGIIMAVRKSPSMSWIIVVAVACLLLLVSVIFSISTPKFKVLQNLIDKLNLIGRENLSGLMVIRAFGNEKREEERFQDANSELANTNKFVHRIMSLMSPVMTIIMNFVTLSIMWIGAHKIAESTLRIGDMMAFMQYSMQIIMSFLMIAMMFIMVPRATVSATRIKEVLDCEPKIKDAENTKKFNNIKGNIEFNNVSFKYNNAEENVINNISFKAKSGETTAFIGSTGSGKSTLVNLIPRFYDVTEGKITIDGTDIRDVSQKDLHQVIGYIPQKGVLFSGDIESNVKYGKDNASISDIMNAIDVAQASEFVEGKEDGLASPISQGGTNVSGGQKQRLSIARALIKNPPIYIFDDSFSALDFKTDAALRRALKKYTGEATILIVAQRVSTIMNADQIIVLDDGRMVGKGTHAELLKNCPQYLEIAESQLSKEELDNE